MKSALIVSSNNSFHLINDLPYILKSGGFHVTVVSLPHWTLTHNSFIDNLISAPVDAESVLKQVVKIVEKSEKPFDFVILGTDRLIWSLYESDIDPRIKAQLSPVANPLFWDALEGKIGVAEVCKRLNILAPPSRIAVSLEEASIAALDLGFPVMLKVSQSGAGQGVVKCDNTYEVLQAQIPTTRPFLVQKYIEGEAISVEPLYLRSHLLGYCYSQMIHSASPFSPSLERKFSACPEIQSVLEKVGAELQMSGWGNFSFIRDSFGRHYLFEMDFRPNRWIRYATFVGVDWAKALKVSSDCPQTPQSTKHLRHFPADLEHALRVRDWQRIFNWVLNRNRCWSALPFYDPKLMFWGVCRAIRKLVYPR